MININTNPVVQKKSIASRFSDFCKVYNSEISAILFGLLSLSIVISILVMHSNTQRFARGLYVEQNFERFMNGNITLNDIETLNKFGESKSLMSDWRYYNKNK